ncbi:3039_t:CDS:2, partial [Racocetra persica]
RPATENACSEATLMACNNKYFFSSVHRLFDNVFAGNIQESEEALNFRALIKLSIKVIT